jgi:phosphatidylglycerophosphatase A
MNFREKAVIFLATGCFLGNIPFAPGTFGSLLGIPLCFALSKTDVFVAALITLLFIVLAIWIAHIAEKRFNNTDPGNIVIDEIAGMAVTFLGVPFNLASVVTGFLLFRVLDIAKPFPIRRLERSLSGGLGIVLDDVIAGIYSNLILRLAYRLIEMSW